MPRSADDIRREQEEHIRASYNSAMEKLEAASAEGPDGEARLTGGEAMLLQRLMFDQAGWKRRL